MTVAVLVWQNRNILLGSLRPEQRRLEEQVYRIRQGKSSPVGLPVTFLRLTLWQSLIVKMQ